MEVVDYFDLGLDLRILDLPNRALYPGMME